MTKIEYVVIFEVVTYLFKYGSILYTKKFKSPVQHY